MKLEVPEPLRDAWGLSASGPVLLVRPDLGAGSPPPLYRGRCGRTLIDLEIRRQAERTILRLARRFGPALPVRVHPEGLAPVAVTVDEHVVGGLPVSLVLDGQHEIVFYL